MNYEEKLDELYIDLPEPSPDIGNTVSALQSGKFLHVCGVLPFAEGRIQHAGRVGPDVRLDNARMAARIAAVHVIALARRELGDSLNNIRRVVRLDACVACGVDFRDHAKVADGASELFVQVFGANGKHVRSVTGASSLPQNACVEISVVFEVK